MADAADSTEAPAPLRLNFRTITGEKKSVDTDANSTLAELKEKLAGLLGIPIDQQRLVYAGRVLKDEEATLGSYNLKTGETINVAKAASNRVAETAARPAASGASAPTLPGLGSSARPSGSSPFGLPPEISSMLDNPFMRSIMENPEFMRSMMQSDPRIAAMAETAN
ncbi:hypothetical protein HDV00_000461 [Rhizophlyctis rosea]|nr:hypothetical protein HDV00_000461 [Rhizophlyctis rosea]